MARPFDDEAPQWASAQISLEAEQQRLDRLAERSCWCGVRHNTGERLTPLRRRPAEMPPTRLQPAQLGVFVSQLPFGVSRADVAGLLTSMLEEVGVSPRNVLPFADREDPSRHAGHAIITVDRVWDAGLVIDALNGHELFGNRDRRLVLRADFARPRTQGASRGR